MGLSIERQVGFNENTVVYFSISIIILQTDRREVKSCFPADLKRVKGDFLLQAFKG